MATKPSDPERRNGRQVHLAREAEAAILAHSRRASPEECCGLLLGRGDQVVQAYAARNAARDRTRRFVVEPKDYFDAIRQARLGSQEVIGAYHSHPRSAGIPSATDRAEAFEGFIFVIVGLGCDPPDLQAWSWAGGNFDPVPIVRCP
jgi:proteasome lid subunit RPN8/RPN11